MRWRRVLGALAVVTGCSPGGSTSPDATSPTPDSGGSLTDACVDYLACAALAIPEDAAAIEARLGEGGACWTSGNSTAAECRRECLDGLAYLQEVYSPDCTGTDTGGGDAGDDTGDSGGDPLPAASNCPLAADKWDVEFTFEVDTCGYGPGNPNPWSATLTCYTDEFVIMLDPIGWPLGCSWDGVSFDCWEKWGGTLVSLDGSVDGGASVVTGSLDIDYGTCRSRGAYTARAAPG